MKSNNFVLPLSIIMAGFLIGAFTAGAIIYSDRTGGAEVADSQLGRAGSAVNTVVEPEAEPTVRDISYASVTTDDHIRGNINASVKIVDYSDFECPFCKRHHETLKSLITSYEENELAWVYRHFPLVQLHEKAIPEAVASECVARQVGAEGFWKFSDRIYTETPSGDGLDLSLLPSFAEDAGVTDLDAFLACLESEEALAAVNDDLADAQSAGGRGTPYSLFISASEISVADRGDLFDMLENVNPQIAQNAIFSQDGFAVGVSGALPEEVLASIVDKLLELN